MDPARAQRAAQADWPRSRTSSPASSARVVILVILVVVLTLLDLVSVILALGLLLAGIAIAGQSIVLDYLMGILILVEGQFYVGDWVAVATSNVAVQGTVEEIGLRRTILRDVSGTVHSISNGEIRVSSNMTRVYAVLQVEIPILPETDLEKAIAVTNRVGQEMDADPEWKDRLLEAPDVRSIPSVTDLGVTLRAVGKVQGADRFAAASELRRRLLVAYAAEGISVAQRPGRRPEPLRPVAPLWLIGCRAHAEHASLPPGGDRGRRQRPVAGLHGRGPGPHQRPDSDRGRTRPRRGGGVRRAHHRLLRDRHRHVGHLGLIAP